MAIAVGSLLLVLRKLPWPRAPPVLAGREMRAFLVERFDIHSIATSMYGFYNLFEIAAEG